jgi:hypothetical protein
LPRACSSIPLTFNHVRLEDPLPFGEPRPNQCRRWNSWASLIVTSLVIAGLLPLTGCGPKTDRLAISGKVTLDGQQLDRGSIRFTSEAGQKLLVSGALIKEGQYNIPLEKGLLPGKYRVQITSPDLDAPPVMTPPTDAGPGTPVQPERIPPEYNVKSDKTVEVTTDGDNLFVFEIVSDSAG